MQLHEGELIKRALIDFAEGTAISFRTILRLTEWLGTLDAEYLNRVVLFVQVWGDASSSIAASDAIAIKCISYGRELTRYIGSLSSLGSTSEQVHPMEFPLAYPNEMNPSTPSDTLLQFRVTNWAVTETHRYTIEVQAYLLDLPAGAVSVTF